MPRENEILQVMQGWANDNNQATWLPTTPNEQSSLKLWATGPMHPGAPPAPPPPLTPATMLSCFEIILLAAAHTGVTHSEIAQKYALADAKVGGAWVKQWWKNLAKPSQPVLGAVPAGRIVFISLSPVPGIFHHVVLAAGNGAQVLSFSGHHKGDVLPVETTTIAALTGQGGQFEPGFGGHLSIRQADINVSPVPP